jgi:hypothetical protein
MLGRYARGSSQMIRVLVIMGLGGVAAFLLSACPTVDLGDVPPDPNVCRPPRDYYEEVIWPQYLAPTAPANSCVAQAGCHSATNGRSALRLDTSNPPNHTANYSAVTRFLNCGTPDASPLLTKPLSTEDTHGGGDLLTPGDAMDDAAIAAFRGWFP